MNKDLDVSEIEYQELLDKVGLRSIYEYLSDFGCGESSICKFVDERGNFTEKKYKRDLIADLIYSKLPAKRKMMIQWYISEYA